MKTFINKNWIVLFVSVFAVLVIIAGYVTSDKLYNIALEQPNMVIYPVDVEHIDEGTDVYTLHVAEGDNYDRTLIFYSNHQEIFVRINGELIYTLRNADTIFGGTPGAAWNIIPIPHGNAKIIVKAVQAYPEMDDYALSFELGSAIGMYRGITKSAAYELVLTLIIILIGIVLTGYWILMCRKLNKQRDILYLGIFAIIFGVWNFGETEFAEFLLNNRAFWSYLAFTCLMVMCLPAVAFFHEFMEVKDKYFYRIILIYIVAETSICQMLHLTGIAGVKETSGFTIASIGLILFYSLYTIVIAIRKKRDMRKIVVNVLGLFVLIATAVTDISSYYTNFLTSSNVSKVGFLAYIIILGFETTRVASEKIQQEKRIEILKEMAEKDLLTGCYNRNAYGEDVAAITDKEGTMVICFDLNDLKKCNDTKGHKEGDRYIMNAARMICDIFGDLGKVYRVGGDEFCILAQGVSEELLRKKKNNLAIAIKHYRLDNPDSGFGIACGYAAYDSSQDADFEETRHRADICMYENKKEVKGR